MALAGIAEGGSPPLVWHVESSDGEVLDSRKADVPVNPASIVKLATSLRALVTLGPDYRFDTRFGVLKTDREKGGTPAAALVVEGGADPDFHFENAILVARTLQDKGWGHVSGDLYVGPTFWIGWERGTVGRQPDPDLRRRQMGERLRQAWTPATWDADQARIWKEMAGRRGWDVTQKPAVRIDGRIRTDQPPPWRLVALHRSEPLLVALRRFNVFSNNDIERLDASIGTPATMGAFLEKRLGKKGGPSSFATSSGLNRNRMSPRLVVAMLHDLRKWLSSQGKSPGDLLPVLGCGPSTLPMLFPRLRASGDADGMAGKTGTLNLQDGGVAALAGYLPSGPGLVFFVAAPRSGGHLAQARKAEEDWVLRMLREHGPVEPLSCPPPLPTSDERAEVAAPTPPPAT